ncbi:GerMN domain-containing protein [Christensenella tenuis]|jgi:hypothetical protein|uniref:GerMN domain-containing protein n=1 Tax=Christensenella tenuis TaxID=2763033 RepID=A0ABR7EDM4_9FIRM|nr:GerMN domain-containing protein [Christensenella tenuis]MBC5647876.1 GerMN domain-containing protein [Christensenella tenuis]
MKSKWKIILPICAAVIVLIVIFSMHGITMPASSPAASSAPSVEAQPSASAGFPASSASASSSPSSSVENMEDTPVSYENDTITFDYFDVVENQKKTLTEPVDGEKPLSYVMETVSQLLFDEPLAESPIDPLSIRLENGSVYIDFKKEILSAPLGASGESVILDSIANGYLNSLSEVTAIYFSVEGQDYASSHIEFPKDQPYKVK